jgi:hypothetical protein
VAVQHFTFRPSADGYVEEALIRGVHPMLAKRLELWRLANFDCERLPSAEDVYLFRALAHENAKDERFFAIAEVRDLTPVRDATGRVVELPYLERMFTEALAALRQAQGARAAPDRLYWNRLLLCLWPPLDLRADELNEIVRRLAPATAGLGLELVSLRARMPDAETGTLRDGVLRVANPSGSGPVVASGPPPEQPLLPMTEYEQRVVRMRRRGLVYPYDLIRMLTPTGDEGISRPAPSPSTTSTTGSVWFRSRARTARTPPTSWSASSGRRPTVPGGHDAGADLRRSEPVDGARWPSPNAGASTPRSISPRRWGCRSTGSRSAPAPGSPWTAAPRTSTGARARSAASSSSRRRAARSTSSSTASTSARSRTGTPRRRC